MHRQTETAATPSRTIRRTIAAALAAGMLLVACGDDDDTASTATTDAPVDGADATTTTAASAPGTVEVTLVDYEFEGLPESVPAGTKLSIVNHSERELHELVAFKLPDTETRTAGQIAALPMDELTAMFAGPPTMVLLAAPGSDEQIPAVGDGTLTEPGRYLVFCSIPTGADPQEYLTAAAGSDGPPQVEGGVPHFMSGMYADLTVE